MAHFVHKKESPRQNEGYLLVAKPAISDIHTFPEHHRSVW